MGGPYFDRHHVWVTDHGDLVVAPLGANENHVMEVFAVGTKDTIYARGSGKPRGAKQISKARRQDRRDLSGIRPPVTITRDEMKTISAEQAEELLQVLRSALEGTR